MIDSYEFYKATKWAKATGEYDIDPDTGYTDCDKCPYSITISFTEDEEDYEPCFVGKNFIREDRFDICFANNLEIMLLQKNYIKLIQDDTEKHNLKNTGYDNEYELLEYDAVSNKTTKYKVTKIKEVEGYHPVL